MTFTDLPRWTFAVLLILCVLAMILWARGLEHHRGEDVGALGVGYVAAPGLER